jgi:hypothetical protein
MYYTSSDSSPTCKEMLMQPVAIFGSRQILRTLALAICFVGQAISPASDL